MFLPKKESDRVVTAEIAGNTATALFPHGFNVLALERTEFADTPAGPIRMHPSEANRIGIGFETQGKDGDVLRAAVEMTHNHDCEELREALHILLLAFTNPEHHDVLVVRGDQCLTGNVNFTTALRNRIENDLKS